MIVDIVPQESMSNDSSDEDEEIELTFDMTKTAIVETSPTTSTHETSDTETLEDTYASLGVTFLELTSQMQNVMKEVTSTSGKSIPSFSTFVIYIESQ